MLLLKKDDHFEKECNERKQEREKKEGKRVDQAGITDFCADDEDLFNVTSGLNNGEDSWILNFECSFHMYPNME